MKAHCTWTEKLQFVTTMSNHSVTMDAKAPIGSDTAPTPKDLLLAGLCGCTAMDVISLLRKHKEPLEKFSVDAEAQPRVAMPAVFSSVHLTFRLGGDLRAERVKEAIRLSQTKFCSISAMLSKAVPIHYSIELNGAEIDRGQAAFDVHLFDPSLETG